jgi:hypothetical protein
LVGWTRGTAAKSSDDPYARLSSTSSAADGLSSGSGPFPTAWAAFGRDINAKHQLFDESVARLHYALEGGPLNTTGELLHPPRTGVRRRIWQATTSDPERAVEAAVAAAKSGDGLQLSVTATAQDVAPVLGWRPPPSARAGPTEVAASSSHPDRWPIRS